MDASLSLEQAPPISVPFRFFLTAPLFGVAAGCLLIWFGADALASRWNGPTLALTHLLTVGFMLEAMCGALLQILPVAAGANVWRPLWVAWITHGGVTVGGALLVAGFLLDASVLFRIAMPVLVLAVGGYVIVLLTSLLSTPARSATLTALRVAVGALGVTVALGAALASAFGWRLSLPLIQLTHLHAAWGLLGWSLTLTAGVAYLVVPMFQLTPSYDSRMTRLYAGGLFVALLVWSFLWLGSEGAQGWRTGAASLLAALAAGFGVATLRLQQRRRRKVTDATLLYWRVAMASLIASAVLAVVALALSQTLLERIEMTIGVLMVVGVFMSAISGMMYKIVPFLNWLHLQRMMTRVPNMKQMLADKHMRGQFWLHAATLALLLGAIAVPVFTYAAGVTMVLASLWLEWNLINAARFYWRLARGESPVAVLARR
jgi:hypothetical protein